MVNLFKAFIFGAIQGLGEFLPISSSGHLLLLHRFIAVPDINEMAFDVFLHAGTLVAVIVFFRKDIWAMAISFFRSFTSAPDMNSRLAWMLIIATIPGALFGALFDKTIENLFRSPVLVAVMLAAVGMVFIIVEKIGAKQDDLERLNWQKAGLIGLSQAIALIPGTSRSGITIIAGLALKLKREAAVRFSFLLSIPIICGAVAVNLSDIFNASLDAGDYQILVIGFISAAVFGALSIRFFVDYTKKFSLKAFAYYRFILAGGIILASLMRKF